MASPTRQRVLTVPGRAGAPCNDPQRGGRHGAPGRRSALELQLAAADDHCAGRCGHLVHRSGLAGVAASRRRRPARARAVGAEPVGPVARCQAWTCGGCVVVWVLRRPGTRARRGGPRRRRRVRRHRSGAERGRRRRRELARRGQPLRRRPRRRRPVSRGHRRRDPRRGPQLVRLPRRRRPDRRRAVHRPRPRRDRHLLPAEGRPPVRWLGAGPPAEPSARAGRRPGSACMEDPRRLPPWGRDARDRRRHRHRDRTHARRSGARRADGGT